MVQLSCIALRQNCSRLSVSSSHIAATLAIFKKKKRKKWKPSNLESLRWGKTFAHQYLKNDNKSDNGLVINHHFCKRNICVKYSLSGISQKTLIFVVWCSWIPYWADAVCLLFIICCLLLTILNCLIPGAWRQILTKAYLEHAFDGGMMP